MLTPIVALSDISEIPSGLLLEQLSEDNTKLLCIIGSEEYMTVFHTYDEISWMSGNSNQNKFRRFRRYLRCLTTEYNGLMDKEFINILIDNYYGVHFIPIHVAYPDISNGLTTNIGSFQYIGRSISSSDKRIGIKLSGSGITIVTRDLDDFTPSLPSDYNTKIAKLNASIDKINNALIQSYVSKIYATTELVDDGDVADYVSFNRADSISEEIPIEFIDRSGIKNNVEMKIEENQIEVFYFKNDLVSQYQPGEGDLVEVTINYFNLDQIDQFELINKEANPIPFTLTGDVATAGNLELVRYSDDAGNLSNKYTFRYIYSEDNNFAVVVRDKDDPNLKIFKIEVDKYGLRLTSLTSKYPEFIVSSCKLIKYVG